METGDTVVGSSGTTLQVIRTYKEGGIVTKETADEERIEVSVPPAGVPIAQVGCSSSMTINLGNFESVKLGISIVLPAVLPEVEEAYRTAKKFIDAKLNKEVDEIREYRKSRGSE